MRSTLLLAFLLLAASVHDSATELNRNGVFSDSEMGFTFTPPSGLRDLTAAWKDMEFNRPPHGRIHFTVLLLMASGTDDTAEDFVSITIATFPRGRDKDPGDDLTASVITNNSVLPGTTRERRVITLAGQDFAMDKVERSKPGFTRHGVAFTTVRREHFLTFMFEGNSRERVNRAAESINSLRFTR